MSKVNLFKRKSGSMIEKLSFLFVMLLLVILVFTNPVKTVELKDKVVINGNYTTITLNYNTGENQSWEYEIKDQDIIEIAKESCENQIKTDDNKIVNGVSFWYIKGISTGETTIKFNLIDNKTDEVINTIKYSIKVVPNKIEVKKGNLVKISLKENHSTCFTWHLSKTDNDIVQVHHDSFIQPDNEPGFAGKSGIHYWYIQGLNQGETELTFELYQDWNKEEINKTVKYIIEVK
jgi:predicted secreted protein